MTKKNITQRDIQAGRDVVLAERYEEHKHYSAPLQAPSQYARLVQKFREEKESGLTIGLDQIIDTLNHYTTSAEGNTRNLSEKLDDGGFSDAKVSAEIFKERINKLITRYQSYKSGQEILLYLLAAANRLYRINKPELFLRSPRNKNTLESFLCKIMDDGLVNMVDDDNIWHLIPEDFMGLFFYLAGHCHIDFDE